LRRLLKCLHTLGAIGMMGSMASFLAALAFLSGPTSLAAQAGVAGALAEIATWVFLPSMALTLLSGLLAMAATAGFHDAGWVWIKAATGILVFEGGLQYVAGPIQEAGRTSASLLAGRLDPADVAHTLSAERNTLWILLAVALANVALGVWRPKLPQYPV
jgi:hypothetical protein